MLCAALRCCMKGDKKEKGKSEFLLFALLLPLLGSNQRPSD